MSIMLNPKISRQSTPPSPAMTPCLEWLPAELQIMILRSLIGLGSLSDLVHASPTIHEVYHLHREELWTQVTLNELQDRGVYLFPPASAVEISSDHCKLQTESLHPALIRLYGLSRRNETLRLSLRECRALLQIDQIIKWEITSCSATGNLSVHRLTGPQRDPKHIWKWFQWITSSGGYDTLVIGKYFVRRSEVKALILQDYRALRIPWPPERLGLGYLRITPKSGGRRGKPHLV